MTDVVLQHDRVAVTRVVRRPVTVRRDVRPVTVASGRTAVVRSQERRSVVTHTGRPGANGEGATVLQFEAGEAISDMRPVVMINDLAYAADNTDPSHNGKVIGVTSGAVNSGAQATVKTDGARMENLAWNWSGGPIYVSDNALTETAPANGFCQVIAVAVSPTAIVIQIGPPIERV